MSNDDDSQSLVYDVEYRLLKRVLDTSSDLVKARNWPEFRDACGGIEKLEQEHSKAVEEIEAWYTDGIDCREML